MTALDAITLGYMGFSAWRGRKRGLADETYRLTRVATALLAGCGLYGAISHGIDALVHLAPGVSDTVGFVASFAGAFALLRAARRRLIDWVHARVRGPALALGGALAGAVRAVVIIVTIVTALRISPVENASAERSWIGRIASVFQSDKPAQPEPPISSPAAASE
ncbi:MAG TPA: CvpA family protein [Kiritimatiellia bacterium]|jgi:uncharacterized membrane protein required for colicin V production